MIKRVKRKEPAKIRKAAIKNKYVLIMRNGDKIEYEVHDSKITAKQAINEDSRELLNLFKAIEIQPKMKMVF